MNWLWSVVGGGLGLGAEGGGAVAKGQGTLVKNTYSRVDLSFAGFEVAILNGKHDISFSVIAFLLQ